MEEFLKPMGVSINALSRDVSVPPNRISEIVKSKRSITADTALRLGKYFDVSPEIWLDLQSNYDIRMAQRIVWPQIELLVRAHTAKVLAQVPISQ